MIPKTVKVGGMNYTVEEKSTIEDGGDKNFWGMCDRKELKIEILEDLAKERKEETFVHELTHAIFNEAGYAEHEEEMIDRISRVLYQVLKENDLRFKEKGIVIDGISTESL